HTRTGSAPLRIAARSGLGEWYRGCRRRVAPVDDDIHSVVDRGSRPHGVHVGARLAACLALAAMAACCRGAAGRRMIWLKLVFGGFGRRGFEAIVAVGVLAVAAAMVAGAMMVIEGARGAMARAEREDRPDIVQVKSRFNRAVFETPRSGNLPPLTLPVYEPLIDADKLSA